MFNERIKSSILFLLALTAGMFATPATAQDDLYYDPATDAPKPVQVVVVQEGPVNNNLTRVYNEEGYSDDDYAYEYSSRIRRFHQPTEAVDYYDPLYTDMYYYDPFYAPGTSIYVNEFNDYWAWRSWQRWQFVNPYAFAPMYGWNSWGWNSWGWNVGWGGGWGGGFGGGFGGWGYPAWGNPYVFNNFYYDPYWAWNGYNPYYCPGNVWVNNNYYNNGGFNGDNGNFPDTYYGPRRGNTTTVDPGFQSANKYKDGRLAPAPNPVGDPERVKNTTANGRKIESDREPATGVERQTSTSKDPGRPTEKPTTVNPNRRPQTETEAQKATPNRRPQTETDVRPTSPTTRPQTETEVRPTSPTTRPQTGSKQPTSVEPTRRPQTDSKQPTNVEPTRRPQTETDVRPTAPVRRPEREVEKALSNPDRRPDSGSKQPTNVTPSSRPQTEGQEVRPSRRPETAPAKTRTEERPTRPSGNSNTRERSNDDTPANARPSRSESPSESRSYDRPSSPSTRSNDSGSSGRSSGGNNNSGGSSGRSSSGGGNSRSGGRN